MIAQTPWLNREFTFSQPIGAFPSLLERLRGTPARAKELVAGVREDILATRMNGNWSAKEHLGHLLDLESLDKRRLAEFLGGVKVLSAADPNNRATDRANHGSVPIADIIARLAAGRAELIHRLEVLTSDQVGCAALHPRLLRPMRLLDWVVFLAEHDDHHLALARCAIATICSQQFREADK